MVALGGCFFLMRGAQAGGVPETPALPPGADVAVSPPTLQQRLGWVGLALVPAALLTAFTTHVTTDVASAPLLWVLPLSLYLLTFVLVFRDNPLIPRASRCCSCIWSRWWWRLVTLSQTRHDSWFVTSSTGVAVFFTSAMVAHRTLYEARPAARYLTEFYLWMSLGGALGGLFAALIAPKIFCEVFEYPLLLALSMACRPGALDPARATSEQTRRTSCIIAVADLQPSAILCASCGVPRLLARELSHSPLGEWGTTPLVVIFAGGDPDAGACWSRRGSWWRRC